MCDKSSSVDRIFCVGVCLVLDVQELLRIISYGFPPVDVTTGAPGVIVAEYQSTVEDRREYMLMLGVFVMVQVLLFTWIRRSRKK